MEEDVVWEPLWRQEFMAVSSAHGFGTDAVLLADFAVPRPGERVMELGTGCGAIALRLCAAGRPLTVRGIDLAPEAIELCRRSAAAFSGAPVPTFSVGDWRQPRTLGEAGSVELVVCNPPYFPPHTGGVSTDAARRRARHAGEDTLAEISAAARWLLKNGGRFCLCHRPEFLNAVLAAVSAAGLEPKRLRPVQETAAAAPWLFLLECRKGGRPGLRWEPCLYHYVAHREESAEWHRIYNE